MVYLIDGVFELESACSFSAQVVSKMVSQILTVDGISRVLYDLTSKPPGTTEWE